MLAHYEIRIAGQLSEAEAAAFDGLDVAVLAGVTVVRGEFDQAGLHGVLERIRMLGLELIDARRVRGNPPTGLTMPRTGAGAPLSGDPYRADRRDYGRSAVWRGGDLGELPRI